MLAQQSKLLGLRKPAGVAVLVLFAALLVWIHLQLRFYAFDDSFIHFRIADNLVSHGAPYYNLGEPVKASSSSAWTIVLAGFLRLGSELGLKGNLPSWVAFWNAVVTLAGAVCYTWLLQRLTQGVRLPLLFVVFFLLYIASVLPASLGLMETPTGLLLVGVGLHLLLDRRPASLVCLGIAVHVRPELVIPLGLVLVYATVARPFGCGSWVVNLSLGLVPFVVYDLYYFGGVIPNTLHAKSLVYSLDHLQAVRSMVCAIISCAVVKQTSNRLIWVLYALSIGGAVGLTSLAAIGSLRNSLRDAHTAVPSWVAERLGIGHLIAIWGVSLSGAYTLAKAFVFGWYTPLYVVPVAFAFCAFLTWLPPSTHKVLLLVLITPIILAKLLIIPDTLFAASVSPIHYREFPYGARVRGYIRLGEYLYGQYPRATLMTSEIGGLGYGFRGRIADGAGLVTPEALVYHPMKVPEERSGGGIGAIPVGFVREMSPELIVSYDMFVESFLVSDVRDDYIRMQCPMFVREDELIYGQPELWGSKHLNVFVRKDIIRDTGAQPDISNRTEGEGLDNECYLEKW